MSIIRSSPLCRRTALIPSQLLTISAWHVETVARYAALPHGRHRTSDTRIPGAARAILPSVFAHARSTLHEFSAAQRARVGNAAQRLHSIHSSLPYWTTIDARSLDAKIPAVVVLRDRVARLLRDPGRSDRTIAHRLQEVSLQ